MNELAVLESIHPPAGPTTSSPSPPPYVAPILSTDNISGRVSELYLEPPESAAPGPAFDNGTDVQPAVADGGPIVLEGSVSTKGTLKAGGSLSSHAGLTAAARKPREVTQWPTESAILVAVRVRPFSPSEQPQLPQAPINKFNFSADASLAVGAMQSHNGSYDLSTVGGTKQAGIRRVVDVLDESVLVFDAPDAESISKYKRALLPVQAYRRFKDMRYAFDRVFHEDSEQQEVFENTTRHLIDGVLNGYNGTLFAYGATGCGKTHTISGTPEKPGIIFLTMQELYDRIQEVENEKTVEISVSYLEVYNETIRDLLATSGSETARPQSLHLREDSSKRVTIAGLSEHHPKGMDDLMELVFKGNENRTVSPTAANATSSRSHAVLQINICQRLKTANVSEDFTVATLSLIDLAGSERASATKNRGNRLIEGANINKSLLALGNCINALCENKPKSHIPYRDSKLTRLLKFSLGGNCKTVMIACVSPSSQHYEETHNTLKYANRAKNIKTKVTKNTLNVDRHVSEYVQAIYELRQEVAELKGKLSSQAKGEGSEKAQQRQALLARELEDTVRKMRATFQTARAQESTYAQLQSQLFIASARLAGLYRWRARFEEASRAVQSQSETLEQERKWRAELGELPDEAMAVEAAAWAGKLSNSLSASSSYINMVDQLIGDLNTQTVHLTRQMQEHEDSLKLYAVSIQSMERKDNPILSAGFPFQRLYELEKKCQALQSHNKILTTKLELSDQSLGEQFLATEDFMELSARSLVGLRTEIETIEQAGLTTRTLNDIYMASITSFTDMTKRIGTSLPSEQRGSWGSGPVNNNNNSVVNGNTEQSSGGPSSPFKRNGTVSSGVVGLNRSKMMSILPEVPQTPVKRRTTSHVLPNLSMDTVDTNLALGSSSLFGSQSPIRMYQERSNLGSPPNPFQVPSLPAPVPFKYNFSGSGNSNGSNIFNNNNNSGSNNSSNSTSNGHHNSTSRRRSTPMAGLLFSPKRRRARGGLRQPRATPPAAKRSVNFLLDIVAEDEGRYTTGLLDPSQPPPPLHAVPLPSSLPQLASIIKPTPFPSLAALKEDALAATMTTKSLLSGGRSGGMGGGARRVSIGVSSNSLATAGSSGPGGARRVVPNGNISSGNCHPNGTGLHGQGGARRVVTVAAAGSSASKSIGVKGDHWRGAQRLVPASSNGSPTQSNGTTQHLFCSPTKRPRPTDSSSTGSSTHPGDHSQEHGAKRIRISAAAPANPMQQPSMQGISAATVARINRRRSMMPETTVPLHAVASTAAAAATATDTTTTIPSAAAAAAPASPTSSAAATIIAAPTALSPSARSTTIPAP
ncbi:kinesin-like protein Klp5, partial [Dissophora globulifera]